MEGGGLESGAAPAYITYLRGSGFTTPKTSIGILWNGLTTSHIWLVYSQGLSEQKLINKKAVLLQRRPRDAPYISLP